MAVGLRASGFGLRLGHLLDRAWTLVGRVIVPSTNVGAEFISARSALACLLLVFSLGFAPLALADTDDSGGETEEESEDEDVLSPYRTPFVVLTERTIGTTSRPVEFDWRRTTVHVGATGTHLFELNNFNSLFAGGTVRAPAGGGIVEASLGWVWVWDTPSSEQLAYTPYRQPGRPDRLELDLAVGYPLAEGVVTAAPRFFPPVELVFSVYGGLGYHIYPGAMKGKRFRERMSAVFSPMLTESELEILEDRRLDAMMVDTGRYGVFVGVGDELYFRQGVFVAPRVMFAVPVLAVAAGSELWFQADLSLTIGVAF